MLIMFIQCLHVNQYVHILLYLTCPYEATFMLLILLPKREGMWSESRGQTLHNDIM